MNIQSIAKHLRNGTLRVRTKEKLQEVICDYIRHFHRCFSIKNNKIVFDNFAGRGYADHPKYIAEEIHRRGLKWDIVWLVNNINEPMPDWIRKVRFRSWRSVYELTTAKYWVDNIRNAHLVPKKKGQIYLQTWHGSMAMKCIEKEAEGYLDPGYIRAAKYDGEIIDAIVSSNAMQSERFLKCFWLNNHARILEVGGPRYDCLFDNQYLVDTNRSLRAKMHIGLNECVILYAPTFRDDNSTEAYTLDFHGIIKAFSDKLKKKCRLIVRLHPNVKTECLFDFDNIVINGNIIPDSNDAIICADILLTDFSSLLYEASLLGKISFRIALDYDEYVKHRPLLAIEKEMPFLISRSTNELTQQIDSTNFAAYEKAIRAFIAEMRTFDKGTAAKQIVDWLEKGLDQNAL